VVDVDTELELEVELELDVETEPSDHLGSCNAPMPEQVIP
jgi:hypothetical protein